jgi:hypothetical protein
MLALSINETLYLTKGSTPLQNMKSSNSHVAAICTHGHAVTTDGVWCNKHASLLRDKSGSADASITKTHKALQISPLGFNHKTTSCCVSCFGCATHIFLWPLTRSKRSHVSQRRLVQRKFQLLRDRKKGKPHGTRKPFWNGNNNAEGEVQTSDKPWVSMYSTGKSSNDALKRGHLVKVRPCGERRFNRRRKGG